MEFLSWNTPSLNFHSQVAVFFFFHFSFHSRDLNFGPKLLFFSQNVGDEISKIAHRWRKVKKKFRRAHLPHTIFPSHINPQNYFQLVNIQKLKCIFCKTQFSIFLPFFWTRRSLNLGATKMSWSTSHLLKWYRWLPPPPQYPFWYLYKWGQKTT